MWGTVAWMLNVAMKTKNSVMGMSSIKKYTSQLTTVQSLTQLMTYVLKESVLFALHKPHSIPSRFAGPHTLAFSSDIVRFPRSCLTVKMCAVKVHLPQTTALSLLLYVTHSRDLIFTVKVLSRLLFGQLYMQRRAPFDWLCRSEHMQESTVSLGRQTPLLLIVSAVAIELWDDINVATSKNTERDRKRMPMVKLS